MPKQTQAGVICPQCCKPLPYPLLYPQYRAEGRDYRTYQGYCFACRRGFIAVQFAGLSGAWILHKYLPYTLQNNIPFCDGQWATVIEPPPLPQAETPPVMTGPGGDFQNGYTPSADMPKLLVGMAAVLDQLKDAAIEMAKAIK